MALELEQGNAKDLFDACDLDSSGYIDRAELAAVVDLDPEDLKEIFTTLDKDEDGRISIEEFTENFNKFKSLAAVAQKDMNGGNEAENDKNYDFEKANNMNNDILNQRTRPRQFTFDRGKRFKSDMGKKAKVLTGQEYLDEIYDAIAQTGNQRLIQSLETFVSSTADSIQQKANENERLDAALRRATEKNSENARNLEEEMEQQIAMLERKIREEEKTRAERAIQEAQAKIDAKDKEVTEIKDKLEESLSRKPNKENESEEEIKARDLENEGLRSRLRESQTQLAVFRSEIANLKSEYDEQGERLSRERQTVLRCIHEQESLTRQLQLLHEANRKLHDTNDDLRAALESKMRQDEDGESSPIKRNSIIGSPMSNYKKNPLSRTLDSPSSSHGSRSAVTSPITRNGEHNFISSPHFKPVENDFNESSLMSELMAADEQGDESADVETEGILNSSMGLPEGFLPVHDIETDFVDTDAETDPEFVENEEIKQAFRNMANSDLSPNDSMRSNEKEQMMEQLRILCETNRRLSESNDELRDALALLSDDLKKKDKIKSSRSSSRRNSHSDYISTATSRSESRCSSRNSKSSRTDRYRSTSSPRRDSKGRRKASSSATSPEGEFENTEPNVSLQSEKLTKSECNHEDDDRCDFCNNSAIIDDEDIIEPVKVAEDESEAFLNNEIFNDDECICDSLSKEACEKENCRFKNEDGDPEDEKYIDVSIQANMSEDNVKNDEDEPSMHVCEGNGCICCENNETLPLDKSIQVSEILLLDSDNNEFTEGPRDGTINNSTLNPDNTNINEDLIIPDSENILKHEQDAALNEHCPDCNHTISHSDAKECHCYSVQDFTNENSIPFDGKKENNELQTAALAPAESKSTFPDFSDTTSNYTDRETDIRTQLTDPVTTDTDSLAAAARHRQGIAAPLQDESTTDTTSGINSSYSVIQNIEDEISRFANQRESDEEIDEDDMTIGELVRIKEMTSSGSDLDSDLDDSYDQKIPTSQLNTTDQNLNQNSDLGQPERTYKIVLAGDAAVGKSSFILRLCKNRFFPSLNSTLGVDFQMKTMVVDGHTIALQLWDTAGQERFRSIAKSYFRRVDAVLLLYDVTSEASYINVREWVESIKESSSKPVPIMLCGNKSDLRNASRSKGKNVISSEQGKLLAKDIDAFFIETSAKSNSNVTEAVFQLARKLESNGKETEEAGVTLEPKANPDSKKSGCCK